MSAAFSWAFVIISFIFPSAFADVEGVCATEIRVNNPAAKVSVDGTVLPGVTPYQVSCREKPQIVRVEVSFHEPFVRVIPSRKDFTESDRRWNVFLPWYDYEAKAINGLPGRVTVDEADSGSVLARLSELRNMLNQLQLAQSKGEITFSDEPKVDSAKSPKTLAGHDEAPSAVAVPSVEVSATEEKITAPVVWVGGDTAPGREIAATAASVTATEEANEEQTVAQSPAPEDKIQQPSADAEVATRGAKLKGVYVQLHALSTRDLNHSEAGAELVKLKNDLPDSHMTICQSPQGHDGQSWTRVFVGPFPSWKVASKVTRSIGRGTFVTRNPECVKQPQTASFLEN